MMWSKVKLDVLPVHHLDNGKGSVKINATFWGYVCNRMFTHLTALVSRQLGAEVWVKKTFNGVLFTTQSQSIIFLNLTK